MVDIDSKVSGGPVIVALGPGSPGDLLVDRGQSIAKAAGLELVCLTIDDGGILTDEAQARLAQFHAAARACGGTIAHAPGIDIAGAIVDYAETHGASVVVVGGGAKWRRDAVASRIGDDNRSFALDVAYPAGLPNPPPKHGKALSISGPATHYLAAFLVIAGVTLVDLALASYVGYWAAAILYLAAISLMALKVEPGPVLFAAILSALAWDYLFIPPRHAFTIDRPEDDLMLALYLLVSIASGIMTSRLRASERLLRGQAAELSRLNALATCLAGIEDGETAVARGIASIRQAIDCEAIVILKGEDGKLKRQPEQGWTALDSEARSAAMSCFEEGVAAGKYTKRFPKSEWHFVPIDSSRGALGVAGVRRPLEADWDEEFETRLGSTVSTMAIALARFM
jgi:Osmosensitive K+ channel histidine kinase